MNIDWQNKLISFGASVDSEGNVSFANDSIASGVAVVKQEADQQPLLVDLSHLAVIEITGEDAKTFLQAQVCNDLTTLAENGVQVNGYCSPKGRLLALFTVYAHKDGYRLILPDDVAETFIKRLQMFVMRAQVSVQICTTLVCSGLIVAAADDPATDQLDSVQLPDTAPPMPATELTISKTQQLHIMRWHDTADGSAIGGTNGQLRYLCIAEPDVMSALWQSDGFSHKPSVYWRWGDINAGIPSVYASSVEQFIPQMLNMQFIDALSFKKGCYPGQEIVARMQYLGKLKKHMKHLRVPDTTVIAMPGDVLVTDANNNAGQVVDAVVDEVGVNLLAVVNIDTDVADLKLAERGLEEVPLPYSIVQPDNQAS